MAKGTPKKKASPAAGSVKGRTLKGGRTKAWKKGLAPDERPAPKPRTPAAQARHEFILERRLRRKEDNIARREAEKAAAELKAAEEAIEAENAKRHDPVGVMVRQRKKNKKTPVAA